MCSSDLTISDIAASVAPEEKDLKQVQTLREELYTTKDPARATEINDKIKSIIKESGLNAANFNVLSDSDKQDLRKLLDESKPMSAAEQSRKSALEKEVGDKLKSAESMFSGKDEKELQDLKRKDKVIDSGITADSEIGKLFSKHGSLNELVMDKSVNMTKDDIAKKLGIAPDVIKGDQIGRAHV